MMVEAGLYHAHGQCPASLSQSKCHLRTMIIDVVGAE